jgi:hypothetical protein
VRHAATAGYLLAKKAYLDYPTALNKGWPIATGVIEGACRHLVKDRMDITGARWSLPGAEAVLKLRALICNGDFDQYWTWHLTQEQRRVHTAATWAVSSPPSSHPHESRTQFNWQDGRAGSTVARCALARSWSLSGRYVP